MTKKRIGWIGLMVALALAGPPVAEAQQAPRHSFVVRGVPLDDALRLLITETALDLGYDPALVADRRAYCVADQQVAEDILRCILRGTGLDFIRLSSGLYVLTEAAATEALRGTLQGQVIDRETGEPLPHAHILLADGSTGTVANEAGRFLIADLLPGRYQLTASFLGYRQRIDSVFVPPEGTGRARLALDAEPIAVAPIIVDGMQWRLPSDSLGRAGLSLSLLREGAAGSPTDVALSLGTLAGVRLNDATADLHVQGGETGEHQFRIDGAPVFVPVSLGGIIGPFSPFALGRVTVHKTGFGAEIGSQSAGVIAAEHALGGTRLDLQTDPMSANGRLGLSLGTPGRRSASLMLAGRYGLWDHVTLDPVRKLLDDWNHPDPFMLAAFASEAYRDETNIFRRQFNSGDPGLGYHDLHGAARVRFGALHSLYASAYLGSRRLDSERDIFESLEAFGAQRAASNAAPLTRDLFIWDNTTAQMRYEAVLGARVLARLGGRASLYRLRHEFVQDVQSFGEDAVEVVRLDPRADNNNRIREYAASAHLDVSVMPRWHAELGIEPIYTASRFLVQGTQRLPLSHQSAGWRVASYWTNRLSLGSRLTAEPGLRLTYLDAAARVYAEPRLALRYDQPQSLVGPWSVRVATGLFRQFVNQFDVSSRSARALLATSRTWLAVDASVRPPLSAHFSAEVLLRPGAGWSLRGEAYLKRHLHLLAVNYGARRTDVDELTDGLQRDLDGLPSLNQATFLTEGEGETLGAAVHVEKQLGRARLSSRYEYSRARRTFGLFFLGSTVPAPWNEPHRVELSLDWQPTAALTLLGRWRGVWGRTWGFRQAYYDFLGAFPSLSFDNPSDQELVESIRRHVQAYRLAHPQEHTLPPLLQLDVSAAYTQHLGAGLRLQARLDLLNVLDRDNVADWRFALDEQFFRENRLLKREDRLLLPFTPSAALRLAW